MLIIIWELTYKLSVDVFKIWKPYVFPSPFDVFNTLFNLIKDNTLFIAIGVSMKRLAVGYFISVVLGISMGLALVKYEYIEKNFSPLILGMQTLPSICWLPFAILWYGLNENAIIFVIAIGSTFAIAIATESGIKNVHPVFLKAAKNMGAEGAALYWNVTIPAALPAIITGMKQGWSFAWRGLMAGEMLAASKGLGQVLMVGRELADISQVVAVMLVIVLLGLSIDKLVFSKIETDIRHKWGLQK